MNEYFEYLTELRDGGTMNMMWAPTRQGFILGKTSGVQL